MIKNPQISEEQQSLQNILAGDKEALALLVSHHQQYLYNFSQRMVGSPEDAKEICQEVWIKAITHLSEFQGKSAFRTWLTRIAINHMLNMKRRKLEQIITNFTDYGADLANIPDQDVGVMGFNKSELSIFIEETKIGCMAGMLLCLSREQRIVYILGDIFRANDKEGADLLDITPANFRQKLTRARRDLHSFMNEKCGLINRENPCRCAHKTKSFIEMGWIDIKAMKFALPHLQAIREQAEEKNEELCDIMDVRYAALFRDHPYYEETGKIEILKAILGDPDILRTFNL